MPEQQKKTAYRKVVRNPQTGRLEVWFFDTATNRRITDLTGYTLEKMNPYELGDFGGGGSGGSGTPTPNNSGGGGSASGNTVVASGVTRSNRPSKRTGTVGSLNALDFVTGGRAGKAVEQISNAARNALDWAAPLMPEPTLADQNGRVVSPAAPVDRANSTSGYKPFIGQGNGSLEGEGVYYGQGIMVSGNVDLSRVDPALVSILNEAAMRSPYIVALNNTNPGSQSINAGAGSPRSALSNHQADMQGHSAGIDIVLIDPVTHQRLPNYQNAEAFRAYETFAQTARLVQMRDYPELSGKFRWGGYFGSGPHWGDLMHFDMDRNEDGMAGGSWENGANATLMAHMPELNSRGMGRVLPSELDDIYPMIYQGPTPVERKIMQVEREALEQAGFLVQRGANGNVTDVKRPMIIPESDVDVDRIIMQAHLQAYNEERTGESGAFDLYGRTLAGPTLARSIAEQANRKVNTVYVDSAGNETPITEDFMAGYNAMPSDYRPQVLVNGVDYNTPPSDIDRFFDIYNQQAIARSQAAKQANMDRMVELYNQRATEVKQPDVPVDTSTEEVDPFSQSADEALEGLIRKRDERSENSALNAIESNYVNDFSPDDVRKLATVAYFETDWSNPPHVAQQQFEGNLQVMMNRTVSPLFPDTVENMLNQRSENGTWQFSPVGEAGGVNNMRFPLPDLENQAINMATDYMNRLKSGEQPAVGGALNFANPYASDPSSMDWINDLDGPTIGQGQAVHKYGTATGTPTQFQFIKDEAPIPAERSSGFVSRVPTKGVLEPRTNAITQSVKPTSGVTQTTGRTASPARKTSSASSGFVQQPTKVVSGVSPSGGSSRTKISSSPSSTTSSGAKVTSKEKATSKTKTPVTQTKTKPSSSSSTSTSYAAAKEKQLRDLGV